MQLLGADLEGISRQLIGVPPQSLLDGSVKSGKITLSARGKLNRIEREGGALSALLFTKLCQGGCSLFDP
jgi:hypothetical protein